MQQGAHDVLLIFARFGGQSSFGVFRSLLAFGAQFFDERFLVAAQLGVFRSFRLLRDGVVSFGARASEIV